MSDYKSLFAFLEREVWYTKTEAKLDEFFRFGYNDPTRLEDEMKKRWNEFVDRKVKEHVAKQRISFEEAKKRNRGLRKFIEKDKFWQQDDISLTKERNIIKKLNAAGYVKIGDPPHQDLDKLRKKGLKERIGTFVKKSELEHPNAVVFQDALKELSHARTKQAHDRILRHAARGGVTEEQYRALEKYGKERTGKIYDRPVLYDRLGISKQVEGMDREEADELAFEIIRERKVTGFHFVRQLREYFTPQEIVKFKLTPYASRVKITGIASEPVPETERHPPATPTN